MTLKKCESAFLCSCNSRDFFSDFTFFIEDNFPLSNFYILLYSVFMKNLRFISQMLIHKIFIVFKHLSIYNNSKNKYKKKAIKIPLLGRLEYAVLNLLFLAMKCFRKENWMPLFFLGKYSEPLHPPHSIIVWKKTFPYVLYRKVIFQKGFHIKFLV